MSEEAADSPAGPRAPAPVFSRYGVASALLGVVAVAAAVCCAVIWTGHRADVAERTQQTAALQAAADWTTILINLNKDNVESSLQKLHDGTVGELNADFEAAMQPYRAVVEKLQSTTSGRVESVSLEESHHDLDTPPGSPAPPDADAVAGEMADRTDTVLVVATSESRNAGGQPQTVRWNLRLDVSEVDGAMLVSRLVSLR
jgi:hypothetical protein